MSKSGTFDYTFENVEFRGESLAQVEVEVDFTASNYHHGRYGGSPETDYPPEGGEIETIEFTILRVVVGHTEQYAEHGGEDVEWTKSQMQADGFALSMVINAVYDKGGADYEAIADRVVEIMQDRCYSSEPEE